MDWNGPLLSGRMEAAGNVARSMTDMGDRLREARKAAGLTLVKLSEMTGHLPLPQALSLCFGLSIPWSGKRNFAGWLPHTTRAVLTGLRKRGYAFTLDRSDAARGSAYHMAVDANAANAGRAPIVIEPPSRAHVGGGSDLSASPVRPVSVAAPRRSGSTRTSRAA